MPLKESTLYLLGKLSRYANCYKLYNCTNPKFVGIIPNQSVVIGRDATFTCNVKNLGPYKVIIMDLVLYM